MTSKTTAVVSILGIAGLLASAGTVSAALVAHYPLDSITVGPPDTTPDTTGQNGSGTLNGGPTLSSTAKIGNSFDFAGGTGEFVGISDPAFGKTVLTGSVWFQPDSVANQGPLAQWTNSGPSPRSFLIRTDGSGSVQTYLRSGGTQRGGTMNFPTQSVSDAAFNLVTLAFDGQTLYAYLNGEKATNTYSFPNPGTVIGEGVQGTMAIGGRGSSERDMTGLIDDVSFFDERLSDAKVRALFTLANEPALNYDASGANALFELFDAGSGSANVGGEVWENHSGLVGLPGEVIDWTGPGGSTVYGLVLDGSGNGVATGAPPPPVFKIDIDSTTQGGGLGLQTEPGWTSLDATQPSENDSVTIAGIEFRVSSTDGSRLRTSGGAPNPNALTGDFVFDDGNNQAVILHFGGAGDLAPGIWDVDLYSNDTPAQPGIQFVGYRTNTTETIVGNAVAPKEDQPAITFQFESDGTSAYDVFVRERGNDRSRLNAVQLTYLSALTPANDTVLRFDLDDGTSDVSASSTTSQVDAVDYLAPLLNVTDITSGLGWGREDPGNGNNANVGNGTGPESQTDDNNTWWSRGSLLPTPGPDGTHYASFTVTVDSGYGLDLSDGLLGVKMGATERNQGGNYELDLVLRTSADGFASDLDVASMAADQNVNDPLYVTSYFDLASLGVVTSPLEFRLYFADNSGSSAKHPILDTVFLLGVVVPEPSTLLIWSLLAGLGIGVGFWRRRK